jgi:Mn2+/Fe2+ NRAMP family transporter
VRRRSALLGFLAVAGPGLLAGLSDDDPAGITTYSVMGADYGYELLWVLLLATAALIVFHSLAVRIGVATGQGLAGLVRERFGMRLGSLALVALIVANLGTTAAELAGVAAGMELAGVSRYASVPVAAGAVSLLVLRGGFRRVEHVLLAVSAVFVTYIASGLAVGPDFGSAARGLAVPSLPGTRDAVLIATAAVGTTLAPWGLAFIQSYAVDKRLRPADFRLERVDVVTGAVLTGVIGAFVILACAATLHADGRSIDDAADAAQALRPLAGGLASWLFGAGLLGAALLAAAILPLSTAYSVSEALGREAALDDRLREAPLFYGTYAVVMGLGVLIVLLPGVDLIGLLVLTQALNAVLLLPLLVFIYRLARDPGVMGNLAIGRGSAAAALATIAGTALCVGALGVIAISGWLL